MALADALTAVVRAEIRSSLARSQGVGDFGGLDRYDHLINQVVANGSGASQATGAFTSQLTVTTGGITISLADSVDPLGGAGDDIPSSDPEGLKLRAIMIENLDPATGNFITIAPGTNGITNWITGTNPFVRIPGGGFFAASMPNGIDALNDGVDDEILLTANTASVIVNFTYLFG